MVCEVSARCASQTACEGLRVEQVRRLTAPRLDRNRPQLITAKVADKVAQPNLDRLPRLHMHCIDIIMSVRGNKPPILTPI
jgi:hypothetical protein